uniref:interleukin-1 beta n=1 Tax=Maylandia zebra TaxID=106582 RepID=UPI000D322077|nr:interleukin-1 beta-like [Maylandia zebra]XP_004555833.2 interleukin-1 beta-like [Maylandia zebra]
MDFKMSYMAEEWSLKMPKGLDLEVSHHPVTMKSVVNLIIAMERLKTSKSEPVLSTDFQDENLLSIMLESIVEEHSVIERTGAPPQFTSRDEIECTVTDSQKRSLVLVQSSMELHAVMLQGGSDDRKVHLNMSTYAHPTPIAETRPVALGIKGTNLYLSCHEDDDKPTLHLEEVTDKNSLTRISAESDMVRFLFYKRDTGLSISSLMSVRCPNWYISTAQDDDQVVEVCQETAPRYRSFNIQRQS